MTIKTISYKKIFPIAQFINETIGIEVQIDEGDNVETVFQEAKTLVNSWGASMQPEHWNSQQNVQSDNFGQTRVVPKELYTYKAEEKPTEEQAIDGQIEAINLCRSIKALGYFEKMVINNEAKHPRLREAYDNKYNSLLK